MLPNRFRIHLTKKVYTSYEVISASSDAAEVQQLEAEKLQSYEYEKSLQLDWDFETYPPAEISADKETF
jgi:hypothetical protein